MREITIFGGSAHCELSAAISHHTDTVPVPDAGRAAKLTVLPIAPALAEAVRRTHNGESVSVLF